MHTNRHEFSGQRLPWGSMMQRKTDGPGVGTARPHNQQAIPLRLFQMPGATKNLRGLSKLLCCGDETSPPLVHAWLNCIERTLDARV